MQTMKLKQWDTCQLCNESISEKDFDKHLLIRHFMTIYDALYKVSFPVKCNCGEPLEDVFKALDHVVDKHEILQNEYMAILRKREMGGETKIGIKKAIQSWNFDKRFKKMSPVKVENKNSETIKKETLILDDVKTNEDDFMSNESFSDNNENPDFKESSKSWKIPGQIIKNKAKKNTVKRVEKIMFKNQVMKSENKNSVLKKPKIGSTIQKEPCSENDGKRILEEDNDKVHEDIAKESKKAKIYQKENDQKPNSDQQMQKMIEVLGNQDAKIVQLTGQNEVLLLENSKLKSLNSEMNAIIETINNEMEERFNDLTNDLKEKKTDENTKLANGLKDVKKKLAILLQTMFLAI